MNKRILVTVTLLVLALLAAWARGADLRLTDGRVLRDYRVLQADALHLMVIHADGVGNVPLAHCPAELQSEYGYQPEAAAAALRELQERDAAHKAKLEAEQQKALEREVAAREKQLQPRPWRIVGRVVQVLGDGALVKCNDEPSFRTQDFSGPPEEPKGRHGTADPVLLGDRQRYERALAAWHAHEARCRAELWRSRELVYVKLGDYSRRLVDGDYIDIYSTTDGRYEYQAVNGSARTVRRFKYVSETPFL